MIPTRPLLALLPPCAAGGQLVPTRSGQVVIHDQGGRMVGTIEAGGEIGRHGIRQAVTRRRGQARITRHIRPHGRPVWWAGTSDQCPWLWVGTSDNSDLDARTAADFEALAVASALLRTHARKQGRKATGWAAAIAHAVMCELGPAADLTLGCVLAAQRAAHALLARSGLVTAISRSRRAASTETPRQVRAAVMSSPTRGPDSGHAGPNPCRFLIGLHP